MLKRILIGLAVLVAVLAAVGFLLPPTFGVERSTVINASPASIYPLLADLEAWKEWSPWGPSRDPTMTYTYGATRVGKGATQSWRSEDMGHGKVEITQAHQKAGVFYDLTIGDDMRSRCSLAFAPDSESGGTRVRWTMLSEAGADLRLRYMGLFIDSMVGPEFERGLASLKTLVESRPPRTTTATTSTSSVTR